MAEENWFARYGIVGFYFVLVISLFFMDHFNFFTDKFNDKATIIAAILAISTLPVGYLLMVFSQLIYYKIPGPWQVHIQLYDILMIELPDRTLTEIILCRPSQRERYRIPGKRTEYGIELILSNIVRFSRDKKNLPIKNRELGINWTRKRFDILSINFSIMWGSGIIWFIVMILLSLRLLSFHFGLLFDLASFISIIGFITSFFSWRLMRDHIIGYNKELFRRIRYPER